MKNSTRQKFLFNCRNGATASRLKAMQEARHALTQDLKHLEASGQQQCVDFTRNYEAATSQTANTVMRPVHLLSELRDARMFDVMGWALCVVELGLSLFFALLFGINALFVVMLTLVGIFMLQAALLLIWRAPERPQEMRLRLKRYVVIPSLVITLLSLLVLIFSRGPLALLLLPLITWALGWLSVGCFGLSAGLGAYGYSLGWSKHAAKRFNATAKEASQAQQALDLINTTERELKPPQPPVKSLAQETALIVPLTEHNRHVSNQSKSYIFNSLLVLVAAVWLTGCQSGSLSSLGSTTTTLAATQITSPPSQLAIYVDWSLSSKDHPLQQASQNVVTALPGIAEKYNVLRVTAAHFGADGWDAEPIIALSLPTLQMTALNETEALIGVVRTEYEKKVREIFQIELHKKLAALTPEMLLPTNVPEPKCTDIQGVLNRIAKTHQQQISIVITDGAENCSSSLQAVEIAQPLVIVLLSEKDNPQSLAHESYEQRCQQLAAAVPGAVIVPHFGDIGSAVEKACANQMKQK